MRATRAYLTSLGTTGLLVLSSVLVLVVASTLVAFDTWPGGSGRDEPTSVVVQANPVQPEPGAGPEAIAESAADAADSVAVAAPPAQAPVAVAPGPGTSPDDSPQPPDIAPPGPERPGPGAPSDPTDTPGPTDPEPPRPQPSLLDSTADGLENTTTYLGRDVVGQVSPDLGTLLTQAGQGLTDLVRALDGTPPPPRGPQRKARSPPVAAFRMKRSDSPCNSASCCSERWWPPGRSSSRLGSPAAA